MMDRMTTEIAPWLTFAGTAFLTSSPERLLPLAAELEEAVSRPPEEGTELLRTLAQALENDPISLEREYVRLFLSPLGAPCPPWQSSHEDPPRLLGKPHESALEWFRAAGVQPQASGEPADHIGLLLIFYARMLAAGEEEELLARFRSEHLEWVPAFCDRLLQEAGHPFYRQLGLFTKNALS
jgi:TorA maturation chaperone TorD